MRPWRRRAVLVKRSFHLSFRAQTINLIRPIKRKKTLLKTQAKRKVLTINLTRP